MSSYADVLGLLDVDTNRALLVQVVVSAEVRSLLVTKRFAVDKCDDAHVKESSSSDSDDDDAMDLDETDPMQKERLKKETEKMLQSLRPEERELVEANAYAPRETKPVKITEDIAKLPVDMEKLPALRGSEVWHLVILPPSIAYKNAILGHIRWAVEFGKVNSQSVVPLMALLLTLAGAPDVKFSNPVLKRGDKKTDIIPSTVPVTRIAADTKTAWCFGEPGMMLRFSTQHFFFTPLDCVEADDAVEKKLSSSSMEHSDISDEYSDEK